MGRTPVGTRLNGKHMMAIAMLAKGQSVKDVAVVMRVTPDTIYTWQKWDAFQDAQNAYISSVAREELDRGVQEANLTLHEYAQAIVNWMAGVVVGAIELKAQDKQRWKMALDFLHHAGILDKQAILKAEMPGPNQTNVNLSLDQRRQSVLASGNADIAAQLEKFRPPPPQLT